MILVDTSAWIEFFRGRDPVAATIDGLLDEHRVALCGPVVTELRRGLRSASERRLVLPLLAGCHLIPQPPRLWEEAGDLGFALRQSGVTVKSLDLLIAAYSLASAVGLLTLDADFERMRQAGIELQLMAVPRP